MLISRLCRGSSLIHRLKGGMTVIPLLWRAWEVLLPAADRCYQEPPRLGPVPWGRGQETKSVKCRLSLEERSNSAAPVLSGNLRVFEFPPPSGIWVWECTWWAAPGEVSGWLPGAGRGVFLSPRALIASRLRGTFPSLTVDSKRFRKLFKSCLNIPSIRISWRK